MRRKLYLTTMLAIMAGFTLQAQVYQVPVSAHDTDQIVQGPCYIFAAMAALETEALSYSDNCSDPRNLNFNEWSFYSYNVNGYTFGGKGMITKVLTHMATVGAKHLPETSHPDNINKLPNKNRDQTLNTEYAGLGEFVNPIGSCATWTDNYGYYIGGSVGFQGSTGVQDCFDEDNRKFQIAYHNDPNSDQSVYTLRRPDGSVLDPAVHDLPLGEISLSGMNVSQKKQQIANVLASGHGVILFLDRWKTPANADTIPNHAIYIYKYDASANRIWYKDSWPTGAGGAQNGPEFYKPWEAGKNLDIDLLNASRILYVEGKVIGTIQDTNCVQCAPSIQGPNFVSDIKEYVLSGSPQDIVWTVTPGLQIISGQGTNTLRVIPTSCNPFNTTNETISVNYDFSCFDEVNVQAGIRSLHTPTEIKLHGPISWAAACPGDVIQLEAIDLNAPYPFYTYQWSAQGGTILNGQGTKVINVQTSSASSSQQIYKVRAYDPLCNRYSSWFTVSNSINNSMCPGGFGGPGGGFIGPTANQMDFASFFEDTPKAKTVQIEIFSMDGKRLLKGEVNANDPVQSLKLVPKGMAIIRLYSPETGEFRSFKHILGE